MFGCAAVHKFAAWNKYEYIALLRSIPEFDFNQQDNANGFTCLHSAIDMAAFDTLAELLQRDRDTINFSLRDHQKRTAYDFALERQVPPSILALFPLLPPSSASMNTKVSESR